MGYEDGAEESEIAMGGKKNRICQFCQKTFDRPSKLKRHLTLHTKEKPFSCPECSNSFSQASNLKQHVKAVHLGERSPQCQYCNQTFGYSTHLTRHIKAKHQQ